MFSLRTSLKVTIHFFCGVMLTPSTGFCMSQLKFCRLIVHSIYQYSVIEGPLLYAKECDKWTDFFHGQDTSYFGGLVQLMILKAWLDLNWKVEVLILQSVMGNFLQCFLQFGTLIIILEEALEDEVVEAHHFFQGQEAIQGDITLVTGDSGMGVMLKV